MGWYMVWMLAAIVWLVYGDKIYKTHEHEHDEYLVNKDIIIEIMIMMI